MVNVVFVLALAVLFWFVMPQIPPTPEEAEWQAVLLHEGR